MTSDRYPYSGPKKNSFASGWIWIVIIGAAAVFGFVRGLLSGLFPSIGWLPSLAAGVAGVTVVAVVPFVLNKRRPREERNDSFANLPRFYWEAYWTRTRIVRWKAERANGAIDWILLRCVFGLGGSMFIFSILWSLFADDKKTMTRAELTTRMIIWLLCGLALGIYFWRRKDGSYRKYFGEEATKNEPNQPPLRMPVSVTPAASASAKATADRGASVAPPPGIAGR